MQRTNLIQSICEQVACPYSVDMHLHTLTGASTEDLDEQQTTWRLEELEAAPAGQGYTFFQKDGYLEDEDGTMIRYIIYRPYYGI